GVEVQSVWSDDGIVLRFDETGTVPGIDTLFPSPEEIEERVLSQLERSAVFASSFREAAGRALLLPRRKPGKRTPLWLQRMRAQSLLASASRLPSFPIVLEAYRECLQDIFDLPALVSLMGDVEARKVRVVEVETDAPSPFARSLVYAFVANWLYEGDAPLAERKVAALSVDRNLLRELLGEDALLEVIPAEVVADVDAWLQRTDPERPIRHLDGLEDVLRTIGDLTTEEIRARSEPGAPVDAWLDRLAEQSRVVAVRIKGESRWVVSTDVARYRDALGVVPPPGLSHRLLVVVPDALEGLVARFARTHTWFTAGEVATRFGTGPGAITPVLRRLQERGLVVDGPAAGQLCDREVFRRLKRGALARLRGMVEPVDTATLASFLPLWQGASDRPEQGGVVRLAEVLGQLEGCALPWSELEAHILPARVRGYSGSALDSLCSGGEWVWIGAGSIGPKNGRVRFVRRENLALLGGGAAEASGADRDPLESALLNHLETRGASFLVEIVGAFRGQHTREAIEEALWGLVWSGWVSNDTPGPLRQLVSPKKRRATARRGRWARPGSRGLTRGATRSVGGRWWSTRLWLNDPDVVDTERVHARAVALLERYGVVGRELATSEGIPGGFTGIYPVLRDMEELGQVRRGWFVAGLGGAQFALPGAVDRLRAARDHEGVMVMAATDPANPYGGPLQWPPRGGNPRREVGALVVLVDGHARLLLGKGRGRISAWPDPRKPEALHRATQALVQHLQRSRSGSVRARQVNGEPVSDDGCVGLLRQAGWTVEGDRLVLELPP
ncbi:MAG: DEAD/DEAH box helicase, partial [Deltaproteobacteria bacterium]|nr:DEAD/DEAH box helicase [Deltaproteobacteria bacterium]